MGHLRITIDKKKVAEQCQNKCRTSRKTSIYSYEYSTRILIMSAFSKILENILFANKMSENNNRQKKLANRVKINAELREKRHFGHMSVLLAC